VTADPFDLVAGFEKERAVLRSPAVEIREVFAILTKRDDRRAFAQPFRETAKAVIGERQPVALLRVFALVDDVEADVALVFHQMPHGGFPGDAFRCGQAAYVRRQDPVGAPLHG
jgi:hypothetical protein